MGRPHPVLKSKRTRGWSAPGWPVTTFAGGGSTQYVIDVAGYYTFDFN